METTTKETLIIILFFSIGLLIGLFSNTNNIVSTKQIEPYKVVLTKVDGKVVKTFYYKQQ